MTTGARTLRVMTRRDARAGFLLVVACLVVYLPGLFSMPPVDRDESRFAQASRQVMQAAEAGDIEGVLVPRIQEKPRLNKPPLIYWLQAGSAWFADRDGAGADPRLQRIGWYRLPSVLCAIFAVLATWRTGCLLYRRDEGFLAALMLALCPMVVWDAHQARADQLLLACTGGALWALASIWNTSRSRGVVSLRQSIALWLCIGLGVMAKGPVTPMIALLAIAALCWMGAGWRLVRSTRPLLGLTIVIAMVGPWVVGVASVVGFERYLSIVYDETLGRAGSAMESHWGPPGYHLVLLPVLFFPGSLVTLIALQRGRRRARRRGSWNWMSPEALLLAWTVPAWIVFEAVMTKLPHYTMVLYPAIALMSARVLVVLSRRARGLDRAGAVLWGVLGTAIALAPVVLFVRFRPEVASETRVYLALGLCIGAAYFVWAGVKQATGGNVRRALQDGGWAAAFISVGLIGGVLPGVRGLWPSSAAAAAIALSDPDADHPIARTGYHEDSFVFLTRGRAERVGRKALSSWLAEHPRGIALYQSSEDDEPPAHSGVISEVSGFNYSKGERVRLLLLRYDPSSPATIPGPPKPSMGGEPTP